jgi:predicted ATPase/DNA-binding SARP family transcriptional activator
MNRASLTIALFGPFEVTVHGQPMRRLRSRSLEWLLAWLVLRHGRPVSRAVLAGTLWPDSDHEPALGNLRTGLLDLRRALGPEAERLRSPTRDSLALDLTGAAVDLLQFDTAIAAGEEWSLQKAVALYRGELLEGCSEEWITAEREARREACLQALEKLAELALERGDPATTLSHLGRAEALDPLRDSVQQRRMQALAASRDLPAALLSYREYRLRLHREMNLEPDPETTRLFQDLQAGRLMGRRGDGDSEERAQGRRRGEPAPSGSAPPLTVPDHPLTPSPSHPLTPSPLPRPLTTLIGRDQDLQEATRLVRSARLVTLIGGGGVGKTRLALQTAAGLAEEYPGRIAFVELAPLTDPILLTTVVATALGLREQAAPEPQSRLQALIQWLAPRPALLVLDNCEHLIEAAAELAQSLLAACPELHLLATSRQRLGLTGELVWRVPSLLAPDPEALPVDAAGAVEHVRQFPAAQLFVERAAAVRPGYPFSDREEARAVARICRRLDGIPLALELAAARVLVLTVAQIAARLDDRFRLLTSGSRGALPRHQTLRALIDWSYDSLPAEEAALLRRLSVFAAGWTLEAAEAVCDEEGCRGKGVGCRESELLPTLHPTPYTLPPNDVLDRLTSLVDRSLVLVEPGTREAGGGEGLRYRMLETVREYAREKLREGGEEEAARQQHLLFFLRLAEEAREALFGPGQEAALAALEAEHDNLRAALEWAHVPQAGTLPSAGGAAPERFLRLAAALWPFWEARGYLFEGRQHLRATLQASGPPDTPARAQALLGAARLALHQSDLDEADAFAQEGRERFRSLGDTRGLAAALLCLGEVAFARGQFAAEPLLAEGLEACRQSGWAQGSARALVKLGAAAIMLGEPSRARAPLEEGLALAERLGDAPTLALGFRERARMAMQEGDYARAGALLEQSLEIWRRLGYKQATAEALDALGVLAGRQGDRTRAIPFLEQAAATYRELGVRRDLAWTLQEVGNAYCAGGADAQARAAYEESLGIFRELNDWYGIACASNNLGMACFRLGDPARAQALHWEALALYGSHEIWSHGIAWSLERVGVVTAALGDPWQAARLLGAASAARARYNQEPPGRESHELEHATAALRAKLGPEAWESAWQAGRAMPREEAIASALDDAQS